MIFAIFACVVINLQTGAGNCEPAPGPIFTSAADCKAELLKSWGPGLYAKGELIPDVSRKRDASGALMPLSYENWSGLWYQCMGKPDWSPSPDE